MKKLSINILKKEIKNVTNNSKCLFKLNRLLFSEANNFPKTRFGEETKPENKSNFVTPTKIDFSVGGCPNSDLKINLGTHFKHCYIEQISTDSLSQYGYYIEANGNAFVVDPIRDIQYYLDLLMSSHCQWGCF